MLGVPLVLALLLLLGAGTAAGGIVNPDISVVGQPFARVTNAADDARGGHVALDAGETEIVFDSYLNPYAKGFVTLAIGEEGLDLEEGFFNIVRGLPPGFALRGGKYRVGFGRLNPIHPHADPFAERFGALAYLPGDEAFNETGVSISRLVPLGGAGALTASVDWLQGDSFRIERQRTDDANDPLVSGDDLAGHSRPGVVGRLAAVTMAGEQSGIELGASIARGTNNVAARSTTTVLGADAKAKLWTSPRSYLVVQSEVLRLEREEASWSPEAGYETATVTPAGGYVYADYNFSRRYNAGASYERFQEPTPGEPWSEAYGLFAGFALLEETTVFRGGWVHSARAEADGADTFTLRVIYSMGPHKAHQF
jgi:hypothetical protein